MNVSIALLRGDEDPCSSTMEEMLEPELILWMQSREHISYRTTSAKERSDAPRVHGERSVGGNEVAAVIREAGTRRAREEWVLSASSLPRDLPERRETRVRALSYETGVQREGDKLVCTRKETLVRGGSVSSHPLERRDIAVGARGARVSIIKVGRVVVLGGRR